MLGHLLDDQWLSSPKRDLVRTILVVLVQQSPELASLNA